MKNYFKIKFKKLKSTLFFKHILNLVMIKVVVSSGQNSCPVGDHMWIKWQSQVIKDDGQK